MCGQSPLGQQLLKIRRDPSGLALSFLALICYSMEIRSSTLPSLNDYPHIAVHCEHCWVGSHRTIDFTLFQRTHHYKSRFCITVQETGVWCWACFDLILEMQNIMVSISENQMKSCGSRLGPMNKII